MDGFEKVVVDFASLCPSIIISNNICYTTCEGNRNKEGLVPAIMKVIYDKRQFAYKVCANSFYGVLGTRNNKYLQLVSAAEKVTATGRELLRQTVDRINSLGCTIPINNQ